LLSLVETSLYAKYIKLLPDGSKLLLQRHLGGCCYLIRSEVVAQFGRIADAGYFRGGWTEYQWRMLEAGYPSALLYPFRFAVHLPDDTARSLMHREWTRLHVANLLAASKASESHRKALALACQH